MSLHLTYATITCRKCGKAVSSYQVADNVEAWAQAWSERPCPDHAEEPATS